MAATVIFKSVDKITSLHLKLLKLPSGFEIKSKGPTMTYSVLVLTYTTLTSSPISLFSAKLNSTSIQSRPISLQDAAFALQTFSKLALLFHSGDILNVTSLERPFLIMLPNINSCFVFLTILTTIKII